MEDEKSEYLVVKLRSGDEIIGKKNGTKKGHVLLHRPLQIQRSTMLDPHSGQIRRNICVFREWLEFYTDISCEIPNDWIGFAGKASPAMAKRYVNELNTIDNDMAKPQSKSLEDAISSILKPNDGSGQSPKMPRLGEDGILRMLFQQQQGGPKPEPVAENMVTAKFTIPPDVFLSIILNMPMFDSWGQEMDDDESDFDDDGEDDSPKKPKPPQSGPKKKPKPGPGEEPPSGWNGRFGFPS